VTYGRFRCRCWRIGRHTDRYRDDCTPSCRLDTAADQHDMECSTRREALHTYTHTHTHTLLLHATRSVTDGQTDGRTDGRTALVVEMIVVGWTDTAVSSTLGAWRDTHCRPLTRITQRHFQHCNNIRVTDNYCKN